ncbi:MAG TPA: DHHA1 domain-containing protein, partial [Pirellulaceae bacterium]
DYGVLRVGDRVSTQVDPERRLGIQRAHSATHILHQALQQHLGTHAQQQGSKVDEDWLRFDFTNLTPVPEDALCAIEQEVLKRIREAAPIRSQILPLAEARNVGAMMLFGEKYPDPVRMISMGEFSRELCGGTHLENTREVEAFELVTEEGVAAGTRRVVALTGDKATSHSQRVEDDLRQIASDLSVGPVDAPLAVKELSDRIRQLRKGSPSASHPTSVPSANLERSGAVPNYPTLRRTLRQIARQINVGILEAADRVRGLLAEEKSLREHTRKSAPAGALDVDTLLQQARRIGENIIIVSEVPDGTADQLRQIIDRVRQKSARSMVLLAAVEDEAKVTLVAGVSKELVARGVHAGKWVQAVAPILGGGGGGRSDLAQAGGKYPEQLPAALEKAHAIAREMIPVSE